MASFLRLLASFILIDVLTARAMMRDTEDDRGFKELRWRLQQMTARNGSTKPSEIAILLLPCQTLLEEGHARRFLLDLLRNADVEYRRTRVMLWYVTGYSRQLWAYMVIVE